MAPPDTPPSGRRPRAGWRAHSSIDVPAGVEPVVADTGEIPLDEVDTRKRELENESRSIKTRFATELAASEPHGREITDIDLAIQNIGPDNRRRKVVHDLRERLRNLANALRPAPPPAGGGSIDYRRHLNSPVPATITEVEANPIDKDIWHRHFVQEVGEGWFEVFKDGRPRVRVNRDTRPIQMRWEKLKDAVGLAPEWASEPFIIVPDAAAERPVMESDARTPRTQWPVDMPAGATVKRLEDAYDIIKNADGSYGKIRAPVEGDWRNLEWRERADGEEFSVRERKEIRGRSRWVEVGKIKFTDPRTAMFVPKDAADPGGGDTPEQIAERRRETLRGQLRSKRTAENTTQADALATQINNLRPTDPEATWTAVENDIANLPPRPAETPAARLARIKNDLNDRINVKINDHNRVQAEAIRTRVNALGEDATDDTANNFRTEIAALPDRPGETPQEVTARVKRDLHTLLGTKRTTENTTLADALEARINRLSHTDDADVAPRLRRDIENLPARPPPPPPPPPETGQTIRQGLTAWEMKNDSYDKIEKRKAADKVRKALGARLDTINDELRQRSERDAEIFTMTSDRWKKTFPLGAKIGITLGFFAATLFAPYLAGLAGLIALTGIVGTSVISALYGTAVSTYLYKTNSRHPFFYGALAALGMGAGVETAKFLAAKIAAAIPSVPTPAPSGGPPPGSTFPPSGGPPPSPAFPPSGGPPPTPSFPPSGGPPPIR